MKILFAFKFFVLFTVVVFGIYNFQIIYNSINNRITNTSYVKEPPKAIDILPAFSRLWNDTELETMLDLISTTMRAMQNRSVTCFINYGTLLGSLRHLGITPWDDDADLGAPMKDKARVQTVLEDLRSLKYDSTWTANTQVRIYGPYSQLYQKDWPFRWPYVDVDLFSEDSNSIWFYNSGGVYKHPKSKVFPLIKRPLGNIEVNSPNDGFDCLSRMISDMSMCTTGFNHRRGFDIKPVISLPCEQLASLYPFVHRYNSSGAKVLEVLKLKDRIVTIYLSDEPAYVIRIPAFNLSFKTSSENVNQKYNLFL